MNDPEWRDKSQEDPVRILFFFGRQIKCGASYLQL